MLYWLNMIAASQEKLEQGNPVYCTISFRIHVSGDYRREGSMESSRSSPRVTTVKEHSQHTIGVEFSSRTINVGEKRIKLQVGQLLPPLVRHGSHVYAVESYGIRLGKSGSGLLLAAIIEVLLELC